MPLGEASALDALIAAWASGLAFETWERGRTVRRAGEPAALLEILSRAGQLALFATLPVLLSFALYFCIDHSLRHALRVADRFDPRSGTRAARLFLRRSLPFSLACQ